MPDHLLDFVTLSQKICLSRYTIYRLVHDDTFPKPRKIGKASRWINSEVEAWIKNLPVAVPNVQNYDPTDV